MRNFARRLAIWPPAGLLVLVSLWLIFGGARLALLGGSFYYLLMGLACLAAGLFLFRGWRAGVVLYGLAVLATIAWAFGEVGPDFWQLLPRLAGPVVVLLWLLAPFVLKQLDMWPQAKGARRFGAGLYAGVVVALAGTLGVVFFAGAGSSKTRTVKAPAPAPATLWAQYGGNPGGTRFSPAAAITPANVVGLKPAWVYRTGDLPKNGASQMFEATPLQVGDTLYLCTPHDVVIALDADTGRERWRHDPEVQAAGIYNTTCRGVAYHADPRPADGTAPKLCAARILVATLDGRMLALDAKSGAACPDFGANGEVSLNANLGGVKGAGVHFVTSPPTILGDRAVVGSFVLDNFGTNNPSGVVRAFDVHSGEQVWAFDAGRADPSQPLKPGETYVNASPNAWSVFSADPALGLVYVPTGNPSPDHFGGTRDAAMERYGSSVVALDIKTGAVRWAFQTVHHDLWDYDVPAQPVLVDLPVNGETVPALVQATKQGEIFLLDRRSGTPLAAVEERPVPAGHVPGERYSPTQPHVTGLSGLVPDALTERAMWGATPLDQLWCRIAFKKLNYQGLFTPPAEKRTLIYPGNNGVVNWGSVSVDTDRNILIAPSSYAALLLRLIPRAKAPAGQRIVLRGREAISPMTGTPYAVGTERPFLSPLGFPCNAPPWGQLTAIDLVNRRVLWQKPLGTTEDHAPLGIRMPGVFGMGGALVTKSGLTFIGAGLDNYLRAYDTATGKVLWKTRLPAGGQATPMSYVSPATGRQYVAMAVGGHTALETTTGDYVMAWSLNGETGRESER